MQFPRDRKGKTSVRYSLAVGLISVLLPTASVGLVQLAPTGTASQTTEEVLYSEDFEDGKAQNWTLEGKWEVFRDWQSNYVLRGREHNWARYTGDSWGDYTLKVRVKLVRGRLHINFRTSGCLRYFIGVQEDRIDLNKTQPCGTHRELRARERYFGSGRWYEIKVTGKGNKIEIFVDGWSVLSYEDPSPILFGGIALETLVESEFHVDEITVMGKKPVPYAGPIIDVHCHIPGPTLRADALAGAMVQDMKNTGTVAAFIFGLHADYSGEEDKAILTQARRWPELLFPFLSGFKPNDPGSVDYVRRQLETKEWAGLGEIYIRHSGPQLAYQADHPVLMQIYRLAAEFTVPIAIHFEPDWQIDRQKGEAELERALSANPNTIFILCHGGMQFATPERLKKFPNMFLVFEILNGVDALRAAVANLWQYAPDRIMVGTDLIPEIAKYGYKSYGDMLEALRLALGAFPKEMAEALAYRNATRILGLKVQEP